MLLNIAYIAHLDAFGRVFNIYIYIFAGHTLICRYGNSCVRFPIEKMIFIFLGCLGFSIFRLIYWRVPDVQRTSSTMAFDSTEMLVVFTFSNMEAITNAV